MTEGYFFYEMAERPLVTSQSSVDEGRRMAELSTSFSPSEADVEAAVTFKGVEAEGSGARYRGQSDSQHDPETEGFIDIPVSDGAREVLLCLLGVNLHGFKNMGFAEGIILQDIVWRRVNRV